jgi:PEP-CTERM motif
MRAAGMLMRNTLLAALLLVLPGAVSATPLSSLEGTTLSIGALSFEFTKVEIAGGLDPSQIDLSTASDANGVGFNVTPLVAGAISVANGSIADIKLEFTVTSTVGITSAGNHLSGSVSGVGSSASVSELIQEVPLVDLGVFIASFGSLTDRTESLGGSFTELHITKNLVIAADEPGSATVTLLAQRYVVPEPATAGLLMLGFSGLAYAGRRR